ncbi:TonB-dependent receptor [Altererythrobacter sp.]|uniref:TonB-dependent receptor n=1 Tax=Altererythrobacter sp. TaxID=1872480 RepID=UPI001AFF438F|nr:TonB-dependent receptor [Altererythrobacter sp.]MBO6608591.1 TonB-dependent receptor [Altererythrobacter sp.]MBO6642844.1 TonB-dependent receptor [Altererythrobacter sp.]MBO6709587.1 TonB-dependent receptor [Altererythrobacter sp.]MBO6944104.1 TonB-dependent receptor [Altererythrobacter sp.]
MKFIRTGSAGSTRIALLSGAAALAFAIPSAAFAQDADEEFAEEEFDSNVIVVTATKREQTLQETPISVSVTSGETLENAQIRDVLDLQSVTPSLRVSQLQTASASTFIIRGFGNGDNNFGIEPSVGVFVDGVFRSRSAGALSDLPNVQRIEVLNGPQSTLFGKNASAGVISVVTREPQFTFGGSVEASYGNFNAIVLKGDVTGPISDNIAFSIDGSYNQRDGFGEIVNLDEDINDRNRWSARGQLLIEPTPDLRIRAIADYSKIDEVCCTVGNLVNGPTGAGILAVGGQLPTDFFSREVFLNFVPENEVDNYGGSVQVDWETGPLSVTSITSYRELQNYFLTDIDFTSADIATETREQDVETFTQELRIASDFDGPINFLLGGFYFDEKIDQVSGVQNGSQIRNFFEILAGEDPVAVLTGQPTLFNGLEAAFGFPQESIFNTPLLTSEEFGMDNTAWSVFGTVDFEPADGLVFTAGFNYTDDKKDFALSQTSFDPLAQVNFVDAFIAGAIGSADPAVIGAFAQANPALFGQIATLATTPCSITAPPPACNELLALQAFQFQPPFLDIPNSVEDGKTRDDKFTYLLRAAYQVSNEVNVYASYATGFKASSVNLSRDSRPLNSDFVAGPFGSTILAPSSPILSAGLAVPNLASGSRFAGPEEAEVYEVGLKAQWPGFGFNMAVFDQSIDGFQSFAFTGTGFALRNAGKQSVRGFEIDTNVQPTDGLILTFAATHLDPLFDSFPGSVLGDLTGERPAGIPAWAIATSATYTHEFASGDALVTRIDYNHESATDINNGLPTFNTALGNTQIFRREVNLLNASITFKMNSGLEFGVWGRNLTDDEFITTVFDSVAQSGSVSGYPNAPRTYGGVVRFKF